MAVTASSISSSNTLEQLRTQFNNLVSDVTGLEAGSQTFTLITSSNITVAEDGTIVFEGATNDDFETTLTVVDPTADRTITLPNETGTVLTTASSVTATNVTVSANNSTDETIFLTFVDGATGTQGLETDTGLTYNPSTGLLTSEKLLVSDGGTIGSASSTSAITVASTGIVTFVDDILIKDGGTIGSASSTGAITIASTGIVTLVDDLLIKDGGTIGNASVADVMTLASTGIVTFKDDLIIKDGGTIGSSSAATAITIASSGIVTLVDDLIIKDGGTIGSASATDAITIASTGIVTFVDDIIIKDAGTIGSASDTDAISISSGGVVNISATTANTGTGDGALTVAGGVGIAADASIGDDLRLISDSAVLSFGADSEITITHVADTGLNIKHTATADDKPIILTLQTGETDMQANDVIGAVRFQAPDEGTGTDAILVAAAIQAVSEGDFSASSNATKLEFHTGASEAASSKMSLSSGGNLTLSGNLLIPDDGNIGSASDTDAIAISSGGVVTISATTANTSASDGALVVGGGVGVGADLTVGDDLRLITDSAVLSFGADSDTTLTHTDGSGLTINSTNKIMFRDSALSVSSSADGQLDIDADTEVEITATTVDINGDVEISGTTTQTGVSTSAAKDVFNAGMSVKNGSTSAGFIEFFEDSDNGTNKVTLIGPSSTSDITLTLGTAAGTIATTDDATALAIALG